MIGPKSPSTPAQRGNRSDGDATRARILEAAGALFAEKGFAETLNKAVARRAEVDIASINYHFGGREGLYRAVLVEAHRRLVDASRLSDLSGSSLPAHDKLRSLMEMLVQGAGAGVEGDNEEKGWHVRVLSRELLAPTSHFESLRQALEPKMAMAAEIVAELLDLEPGDPQVARCLVSIAAPCAMLVIVGPDRLPMAAQVLSTPRQALVDHLYGFALGGIAAIRSTTPDAGTG